MNPEITVIVPTFNSGRTLGYTLSSLLLQDFENFEVWVVGDACTDDSQEVVKSFGDSRLNWVNLPENSGDQSTPNNEGIRRSKGTYITYLAHDDLIFPWHISTLLNYYKESQADLVYPVSIMKMPDQIRVFGPLTASSSYDYFYVPQTGLFHKKELLSNGLSWVDPSEANVPVGVEFLNHIFKKGYKISFSPVLSVLKFPSLPWKLYDPDSPIPQKEYYEHLMNNPHELERSLLTESTVELARLGVYPGINSVPRQLYFLTRDYLKKTLIRMGGKDRWPLSAILYWKYHKRRRKARIERGLHD